MSRSRNQSDQPRSRVQASDRREAHRTDRAGRKQAAKKDPEALPKREPRWHAWDRWDYD